MGVKPYCGWSGWCRWSCCPSVPSPPPAGRCAAAPRSYSVPNGSPGQPSCGKPWTGNRIWAGGRTGPGPVTSSSPAGTAVLRPSGTRPGPGHSSTGRSTHSGSSPGPSRHFGALIRSERPGPDSDSHWRTGPSHIPAPDRSRPGTRSLADSAWTSFSSWSGFGFCGNCKTSEFLSPNSARTMTHFRVCRLLDVADEFTWETGEVTEATPQPASPHKQKLPYFLWSFHQVCNFFTFSSIINVLTRKINNWERDWSEKFLTPTVNWDILVSSNCLDPQRISPHLWLWYWCRLTG